MKTVLIDLWFPNDYYDILIIQVLIINLYMHMKSNMFKTWKVNYKTKIVTVKSTCQVKKRVWGLRRSSLFLKKILKWLKTIKTCNKLLNWRLKIYDTNCQKLDEEFIEKKVELIVDNDRIQNMVIVENIEEDPIEVNMRISPQLTILSFRLICWRWLHNMLIFLE